MLFRSSAPHALLVACAAFAGCSGGGAAVGSTSFTCGDTGAKILCLQACSLGCSTTGCLRSDIAQNEIILLQFSEDVDRASVSTSTIQFRTAGGDMPVGEFFVNGSLVEFVPTLLVSGSQSYFGFLPGETYTLTIPGGPNEQSTLRSTAGRPFGSSVTCTLVASQGIKDYNGVGPEATLVSPSESHWQGAPLTTIIQLDFNEMIDATPFLAATGSSGPVTFTLRRTREAGGGVRECDTSSLPVALPGTARLDFDPARNVSVLTFRSNADLTANTCIEINVTSSVRDIAGNRAQPKVFRFLTESRPLVEVPITEEFLADGQLDRDVSSGTWAGGAGTFGVIGGDGRHGTFRPELGTNLGLINGKRTFSFNTDLTVIPETNTRLGVPLSISDGKFYFDKIVVPADVRVRFTGTRPPQFMACGKIDVLGEIDVAGETLTTLPANTQATGQLGGAGGIFGGSGGQGGDKCFGTGYLPNYDGRVGSNANLIGGHAYATSVSGTGGRGSRLFPLSGNSIDLIFAAPTGVNYTPSAAAGGGGGGMRAEGAIGRVVSNNHPDPILLVPPRLDAMGPPAAGGTALQLFPWPATGGILRASEHFLVGGSGGGGAGSHACLCIAAVNPRVWSPGGGGGGGGGALSLRAGDSLSIGALGRVNASGGAAASSSGITASSSPAPGGGGSGGSVVLQSGRLADLAGAIDVRGGNGGNYNRSSSISTPPSGASVQIAGGNGSAGFVRCELPGTPTPAVIANALPAPTAENVGTLAEQDDLASFQSLWYSTNLPYGPEYARYEIHATINGLPVVFSDDPAVSTVAAGPGAALRAFFQNANLDVATGLPAPLPGETAPTIRPWRTSVRSTSTQTGIASDGLNGFRFALVLDRTFATDVSVDKVIVVYRI